MDNHVIAIKLIRNHEILVYKTKLLQLYHFTIPILIHSHPARVEFSKSFLHFHRILKYQETDFPLIVCRFSRQVRNVSVFKLFGSRLNFLVSFFQFKKDEIIIKIIWIIH